MEEIKKKKRLTEQEMIADTAKKKKKIKFPLSWKIAAKKSSKDDNILVQYLSRTGEVKPLMSIPIYNSNMVIIHNKVHILDPRSLWNVRLGRKYYRMLIQREIDRNAVSNLEIPSSENDTSNDQFLIQAALKAFVGSQKKPVNKKTVITVAVVVIIAIVGFVLYSILKGA